MKVDFRFDARGFKEALQINQKQAVYGLSVALNTTMRERQQAMQRHISSRLQIRDGKAKRLFEEIVKFPDSERASVKRQPMSARLLILGGNVNAQEDKYRRIAQIAFRHDDGGSHISNASYLTQRREFAPFGFIIPSRGLRTATTAMSKALYPAYVGLSSAPLKRRDLNGLGFQYKKGKKKRGGFKKGTKYYFVKPGNGIWERVQKDQTYNVSNGPHPISRPSAQRGHSDKGSEYRQVWWFRRKVNIPKRLDLEGVFGRGIEQRLAANFSVAFEQARATARP